MEDMILKTTFTKFCSLAVCAGLTLSLAACGGANKTDSGKKDGDYVTVNGTPISYDEFRYYFLSTKASMENANTSASSDSSSTTSLELSELLTAVEENLKKDYGVRAWSDTQNAALTDEEKQSIADNTQMMITMMGGEEGFKQALESIYCTEDLYNTMSELQAVQQKALQNWFDANYTDKVVEFFTNTQDYVHVQHVLIQFADTAEGADHSAELAKAQEVYNKAMAGENFEDLITEYNEDPGQNADMNGYTFTYGSMVQEFEDASFALEENAISEPVETSYGYHIIKRLPIDLDYVRENASTLAPQDIVTEANSKLDTEIQSYIDKVEVKQGPMYDSLTIESFADTIPTPTPAPESTAAPSSLSAESSSVSSEDSTSSESSSESSSSSADSSSSESSSAAE